MGIVHVTHLKSGTISGKTARAKSGKTPLVGQLAQRIILIHKLGQLGGTKEFLHCRLHRLNINQYLRRDFFCVMGCHSLTHYSLQSGKTNPVLILQKLAYSTDTPVAQVVNIIIIANTIFKMNIVIDRCKNIFLCNMFRNKFMDIFPDSFRKSLRICTEFFQDLRKYGVIHVLRNAQLSRIAVHKMSDIHHQIGKNLHILFLCLHIYIRDSRVLQFIRHL